MSFRSLAFKLIARAGCCVHQLFSLPHQCFPVKLFLLISQPWRASEFAGLPACTKDKFTRALEAELNLEELPDVLLQQLVLVASLQHTDIGHVECNHAAIRRQIFSRIQTWVMPICAAFASWMFQRLRTDKLLVKSRILKACWKQTTLKRVVALAFAKVLLAQFAYFQSPGKQRQANFVLHARPPKKVSAKPGKRTPIGGTCRAFVRNMSDGKKGKPNFQKLHADYQELKASGGPLYDTLQALGRAHTVLGTSFKRSCREALKRPALQRHVVRAFFEKCSGKTFSETGWAIVKQTDQTEVATRTAISLARACERLGREAKAAELHGALSSINQFVEKCGKEQVLTMSKIYKFVSPETFEAIPLVGSYFLQHTPPTQQDAITATNLAYHDYHRSNLGTSMSQFWSSLHDTVPDTAEAGQTSAASEETLCCKEGMCLCSGTGKQLKQFRTGFNAFLKAALAKNPGLKSLLQGGSLVVQFTVVSKHVLGVSPAAAIASSSTSSACSSQGAMCTYFHLGLMYFSPFRATMHLVRICDSMPGCPVDRIFVEVMNTKTQVTTDLV
eukprot:424705-Amphidinium_carterae.2